MNSIIEKMIRIAEALEEKGQSDFAGQIDVMTKSVVSIKTAQYVGAQGYWIRNSRCWGNCYRQKRSSNPKMPVQNVWTECLEEYQASINDDSNSWAKYAESNDREFIRYAQSNFPEAADIVEKISSKIEKGLPVSNSIVESISEGQSAYRDQLLQIAHNVASIGKKIASTDQKMASDMGDVAVELIKEAQWWNKAKEFGRGVADTAGGLGKGIGKGVGGFTGGLAGGLAGGVAGGFMGGMRDAYNSATGKQPGQQPAAAGQQPSDGSAVSPTSGSPSAGSSVNVPGGPAASPTPGFISSPFTSNPTSSQPGGSTTSSPTSLIPPNGSSIDPANVPSIFDSLFGSHKWDKPSVDAAVRWLQGKLSTNPPASPTSPSTPTSSAPAAPGSSTTPSPTSQAPTPSNPSPASPNAPLFANGPAVPATAKSFWDSLTGDQKKSLLKGNTQNSPTGIQFPGTPPPELVSVLKGLDPKTRQHLYRTSQNESYGFKLTGSKTNNAFKENLV